MRFTETTWTDLMFTVDTLARCGTLWVYLGAVHATRYSPFVRFLQDPVTFDAMLFRVLTHH